MAPNFRRIALFGGSFDPVHSAHLWIAFNALEACRLDQLFFVPAAQSPFKPDRHPAGDHRRLAMLRLALAGQTRFSIDDRELSRGGVSYSIETVRAYRDLYPEAELFYLIGADHIAALHKWRDAEELARQVTFVSAARPGAAAKPKPPAGFRLRLLEGPSIDLSSSQLRERIRDRRAWKAFTPELVASYIENHGLYHC